MKHRLFTPRKARGRGLRNVYPRPLARSGFSRVLYVRARYTVPVLGISAAAPL
jgi:hypothetical protein